MFSHFRSLLDAREGRRNTEGEQEAVIIAKELCGAGLVLERALESEAI